MIYNVNTRELRTDEGKLLKKLDCPLHKEWSQLTVLEDAASRHCGSCQKRVVNLEGKNETEVAALLDASPHCCVYINPSSGNIATEGYKFVQTADPCPFRRIRTARGEEAINQGAKDGFWPLVKRVIPSHKIQSIVEIYQNEKTGEIKTIGDRRRRLTGRPSHWKRIIDYFTFYPYPIDHPIAAYLLPADLKIGERVFLTDVIGDLVGVYGNQGHIYRLDSAYATWEGNDFHIEWSEERDAARWIG